MYTLPVVSFNLNHKFSRLPTRPNRKTAPVLDAKMCAQVNGDINRLDSSSCGSLGFRLSVCCSDPPTMDAASGATGSRPMQTDIPGFNFV